MVFHAAQTLDGSAVNSGVIAKKVVLFNTTCKNKRKNLEKADEINKNSTSYPLDKKLDFDKERR